MKTLTAFFAAGVSLAALTAPASAAGVLDFMDQCIKVRAEFREASESEATRVARNQASVPVAQASPDYRDEAIRQIKHNMRLVFDRDVAPSLRDAGVTDVEPVYAKWEAKQFAETDPRALDDKITQSYRVFLAGLVAKDGKETAAQLDKVREGVDACKSDVGSQALRVVLAPIGIIAGNFEAAKKESGVIDQALKFTTGISVDAIKKNGLGGGPNSVVHKIFPHF